MCPHLDRQFLISYYSQPMAFIVLHGINLFPKGFLGHKTALPFYRLFIVYYWHGWWVDILSGISD